MSQTITLVRTSKVGVVGQVVGESALNKRIASGKG